MLELTIRDTETDRQVTFRYDAEGDFLTEVRPNPQEALPSTFGLYQLDEVEEFLRTMIEEMELFYAKG